MTITPNQLKLFWMAARRVKLDEDMVRVALVQIAGVSSVKELDKDGFNALMGYFEWLGFRPVQAMGENYGQRPGMASFAQIELIRALWYEYTKGGAGEDELNKWLLNKWQLSSLRFLPKDKAGRIITALKAMKARRAA